MNEPNTATDALLTDEQRATLRALLATFVPASADGRMPSAADLPQLVDRISQWATSVPALRAPLDAIQAEALAHFGAGFAALDEARRSTMVDQVGERHGVALRQLALETVTCYYQQDLVLERLGLEARPPFPKGYQIVSGDLSLLHAVKARGRMYRDAGD